MTLPDDGFPRITARGLAMLQLGLDGDFAGWTRMATNHPMHLPASEVSHIDIKADPESMHFLACPWYGPYPILDSLIMTPSVPFDRIDLNGAVPASPIIRLRGGDGRWGWMEGVSVAVDDGGAGTRHTTRYDASQQTALADDSEDEESEEACERIQTPSKPAGLTLEAFL